MPRKGRATDGTEAIPPCSWSRVLAAPGPCGECGADSDLLTREIGQGLDDGTWRCASCFAERRKLLRKYGPTPQGRDCAPEGEPPDAA